MYILKRYHHYLIMIGYVMLWMGIQWAIMIGYGYNPMAVIPAVMIAIGGALTTVCIHSQITRRWKTHTNKNHRVYPYETIKNAIDSANILLHGYIGECEHPGLASVNTTDIPSDRITPISGHVLLVGYRASMRSTTFSPTRYTAAAIILIIGIGSFIGMEVVGTITHQPEICQHGGIELSVAMASLSVMFSLYAICDRFRR